MCKNEIKTNIHNAAGRAAMAVKGAAARASLLAGAISMAVACPVYADEGSGDALSETISSTISSTVSKSIGALAAMLVVAALIAGGMSAKDFAEGNRSNNPDAQDRGTKSLTYAVGMLVAAGILLGVRSVIQTVITTAIGGA